MTKLRGFIFETKLVLVLKTIESDDKTKKNALFIHTQKQKQLTMKGTLMMMYLNQSILLIPQLYQTYKILEEKVQAGLLIQS